MKFFSPLKSKNGFTLVELMTVIAIMAILAAAGAAGVTNFVPGFQQKACADERRQAVRVFVSDWLETRTLYDTPEEWLTAYLSETDVNCNSASNWTVALTKNATDYTVTITCPKHPKDPASATFGQSTDSNGGISWDDGFNPN